MRRRVLAYHLILTCYGFWLPNDPRGSNSTTVWAETLKPFGPATKTDHPQSVANKPHDRDARFAAKRVLKQRPIRFTGKQARAVGQGFGHYLEQEQLGCLACSILPDHAHLVILRSPGRAIEDIANKLKLESVHALLRTKLHPHQTVVEKRPKVWARGDRHIFLWTQSDIDRSVNYVRDNPGKHGFPDQHWSFAK